MCIIQASLIMPLYIRMFCVCLHDFFLSLLFSKEMAAAPVPEVQREEEVRLCGGPEGGHASRTREEDHQRPRGHDQPEVPPRQEGVFGVSVAMMRGCIGVSVAMTRGCIWGECCHDKVMYLGGVRWCKHVW